MTEVKIFYLCKNLLLFCQLTFNKRGRAGEGEGGRQFQFLNKRYFAFCYFALDKTCLIFKAIILFLLARATVVHKSTKLILNIAYLTYTVVSAAREDHKIPS